MRWPPPATSLRCSASTRCTPGYHTFEYRWALADAFRFHLDVGKEAVNGASVTPYSTRYLRLGPSIATIPEEVDAVAAAIADLV